MLGRGPTVKNVGHWRWIVRWCSWSRTTGAAIGAARMAHGQPTQGDTLQDLNEVTLQGRLATKPEVRQFDSGVRMVRLLITTRQEEPRRRVDVIPVSVWDISDEQVEAIMETPVGAEVWITGSIQRRFWSGTDTRSRLEVIAHQVTLVDERLHDIVVYGEAG